MRPLFPLYVALASLAVATHWAPNLHGIELASDGGWTVYWSVDLDNFPDADAPDDTWVLLDNRKVEVVDAGDSHATIPKKTLEQFRGTDVVVGVDFLWKDPSGDGYNDQKVSSFDPIYIYPANGSPSTLPARDDKVKPVKNVHVISYDQHRVTLGWDKDVCCGQNYGKVIFRVHETGNDYSSQYDLDGTSRSVTNGPLRPNHKYTFSLKSGQSDVVNWFYSNWVDFTFTAPPGDEPVIGWVPWYVICPGGVYFPPGAKVSAVWRRDRHLDLFAIAEDGTVMTAWWEIDGGWRGWFPVCPDIKMRAGNTVTALWRGGDPLHMDLFVTSADGAVWTAWWEPGHGWMGWYLIHQEIKMHPGAQVTALWRDGKGFHIDLFATSSDGVVWTAWWEEQKGWMGWYLLHPEFRMNAGAPVTALWRDNDGFHLDIFATAADGSVWTSWWEDSKGWMGWYDFEPSVRMQGGSAVSAFWEFGSLFVVVPGTDGTVWKTSWQNNRGWLTWSAMPGGKVQIGSQISASANEPRHPTIVGTDNNGNILRADYYGRASFDSARRLEMVPGGAQITALWAGDEHMDVFVIGKDNTVWATWYDPNYYS